MRSSPTARLNHRIWAPILALAAAILAYSPAPRPAPAFFATAAAVADEPLDRIILKNGQVIEGRVLSETDTQVEMLVMVGGISAPATYSKSNILSIERGVVQPVADSRRPSSPSASPRATDRSESRPGAARLYVMRLNGNIGFEISKTPLRQAFDDAMASNPDAIVVRLDAGSFPEGFDGMWGAEALAPIVTDAINAGHRVVFWIKRAEAGAAFLPLVCPEIYFTSDGRLGGVGDLADFNVGEDVVNLKQISLRIGHAEGLAITGGYEPKLIRAMSLKPEWLAVRFRGGAPEYITWEPRPEDGDDWHILTDNGEGKNKDEFSFEGNDVLTLNADWAFRIGVARGVVDTIDDLAFELNIGRDYEDISGRSVSILNSWRDRVRRARTQLQDLNEELGQAGRGRGDAAALGRQINTLRQMRSLYTAFEEVFDADGVQRSQIDIQIEDIRQRIRDANRRRR